MKTLVIIIVWFVCIAIAAIIGAISEGTLGVIIGMALILGGPALGSYISEYYKEDK